MLKQFGTILADIGWFEIFQETTILLMVENFGDFVQNGIWKTELQNSNFGGLG